MQGTGQEKCVAGKNAISSCFPPYKPQDYPKNWLHFKDNREISSYLGRHMGWSKTVKHC